MTPKPRNLKFESGKGGAALAIRVTLHAHQNEIKKILQDGTIRINIDSSSGGDKENQELVRYLAEVLGVGESEIEIIAGQQGRNKLVSVYGLDTEIVNRRIRMKISK